MKNICFLICAGEQKRFGAIETPKALLPLNAYGDSSLSISLNLFSKYCDYIYVVVNNKRDNSDYKTTLKNFNKIRILPISSGLGDAHAISSSFDLADISGINDCFVAWGDAIHYDPIIFESIIQHKSRGCHLLVPCHHQETPYVKIVFDNEKTITETQQKKKGEWDNLPGWHDLSVFNIPVIKFKNAFDSFYKNNKNETSLIELIGKNHSLNSEAIPLNLSKPHLSFNTYEEYLSAVEIIKNNKLFI